MTEEFLNVYRLLGLAGTDEDGNPLTSHESIQRMRDDPECLELERSLWEHILTTRGRQTAEQLVRLLLTTTNYVSGLIGGPIAVMLPREDVAGIATADRPSNAAAVVFARPAPRCIQPQVAEQAGRRDEDLLAKVGELLTAKAEVVPVNGRYLDTKQIGARIGLATKTVRRLCRDGLIDATRTAGGEWRTTAERLEKSRYLRKGRKGGRGNAEME